MKKWSNIFLVGGVAVAFGPLLLALLSIPLGSIFQCTSGGGSPGVCAIGGAGMGDFVYMLAMLHWLTLLTFLPGMGLVIVGILLRVVTWAKAKSSA
jgi:hypothetical protein